MKRLALFLTLNVIVFAGCALFRDRGASSGPPEEAGPSIADRPAASVPPATPAPPSDVSASPVLRTEKPDVPTGSGSLTGILGFDSAEGGCAYLETPDGKRYQVIYPDGWRVDPATGHLLGPDGQNGRSGATVSVRGSMAPDMASICQIGPMFRATEVVSIVD